MRIVFFGALLFAFYGSVSAQDIFISFTGEREIRKITDIKNEVPETIKRSIPCRDYFLYQANKDGNGKLQKIIIFNVSLIDIDIPGTNDGVMIVLSLVKIKLDDAVKIPTARWSIKKQQKPQMIIRISKRNYQAANCISQSQ